MLKALLGEMQAMARCVHSSPRLTGHGELAMYFVGYHRHVVPVADVAHALQLFGCPHPSGGIVRIAQQQHPRAWVGGFLLQVFIIHAVRVALQHQRVGDADAAAVAYGRVEAVVHRALHQHTVARARQGFEDGGDSGHYARGINHFLPADVPPVAAIEPVAQGRVVFVGHACVAEDAVSYPALQGVDDGLRGAEVHVGHPHG